MSELTDDVLDTMEAHSERWHDTEHIENVRSVITEVRRLRAENADLRAVLLAIANCADSPMEGATATEAFGAIVRVPSVPKAGGMTQAATCRVPACPTATAKKAREGK